MPNFEFQQIRMLKKYADSQASRTDDHRGSVLCEGFDFDKSVAILERKQWSAHDIINYVIASNPVLWAQYWLRNPQDPSKPLQLYWYQKNILNCRNRYKLTRCGRQIGKTLCLAVDMLHSAMTNEAMEILYVVPYQAQVMVLFDETLMPLT